MEKTDLLNLAGYIVIVGVLSFITNPLITWLLNEPMRDDLLPRSVFMGVFGGTILYFWEYRKDIKKKK